ncbi:MULTISPECIES: hypothetical protein [Micrococcaceae]|jgi:hypothetical protein|uniref:hypothetical protein n=1 Tax=Micrococcaceae TaxID=1268 RepID=UPI0016100FDF|nr:MULTISPECIES: hypothetical protein [Micrococcaceae]MBB5749289.1 hypothetical protein [Micrococcus sp. TA1]HRO30251.1 hypothetical protein [Citricoccus sp.]HRO93130.1 hypothetical protein [Citricoccus sp.]
MAEASGNNADRPYRQYLDDVLAAASPGLEEVVNSKAFGHMLSQTAGNLVALHRLGNDALDLVIRNARLAGRSDVTSLHRQLSRNEDKLEMVLESVERLEDELAEERRRNAALVEEAAERDAAAPARPARRTSRSTGAASRSTTGDADQGK